jgi:hypothetical protein
MPLTASEDAGTAPPRHLGDFLGGWRVVRDLRHDDGSEGRFEGLAAWTADGPGAVYAEHGQLWLAGQGPFTAERCYRWGADLTVFFEDGRVFHRVPPRGGAVCHWCPPDQYDGDYSFADWPLWRVVWRVTGPRKSYVSTTTYQRA